MSSSFHHESRQSVVAHARSASRAEFIQVTLAAHGIPAAFQASSVYPSVDFVEGRAVSVESENVARALEILETLGLADDPV